MPEDAELLRRYVSEKSDAAFAELVRRHLDLVYSVALRHVAGDTHLAQDVSQVVFTSLARKARSLAGRPVLAGWLYRATQFAAIDAVRSEARRRSREQEAHVMHETTAGTDETNWANLRPLLDRAIGRLNDDDRDAIVLRYFNGRSFAEIGAQLRLTENAGRMRVQRALDKLHGTLAREGVTSTAAALAAVLATPIGVAAPVGLAGTVTTAALSGATSTGGVVAAWGALMTATKLQIGIAGAIVAAGIGGYLVQATANAQLRDELAQWRRERGTINRLRTEIRQLASAAAEVEALKADDAEFARLRDQANALKAKFNARTPTAAVSAASTWRTSEPVYVAAQLDQQPKPKYQARPEYPSELRKMKVSGEVRMSFVVDADGNVQDVKTISATNPALAASAAAAVQKWTFEPGKKAGVAVNVRIEVPVVFTIGNTPVTIPTWF